MAYETIAVEQREDGVRVLTLDRPDRLNALTDQLVTEASEAISEIGADPASRVLVITGRGRAFCAGADIGLMDDNIAAEAVEPPWGSDQIRVKVRTQFQPLVRAVFECPIPTIAAVRGPAVGGGFDLACACDLVVASETARFMVAYIRRGLFPDLGGFWLLPRLIGYRRAAELLFTGRFVEVQEAATLGLVNRVVADADLEAATNALAGELASGPPIALRLGKMLMQRTERLDFPTALEMGAMGTTITETSMDFKDSIEAVLDGREPRFRGR